MSARMTRAVVTGSFLLASALAPGLAAARTTPPSQGTKPAGQAGRPAGEQENATAKGITLPSSHSATSTGTGATGSAGEHLSQAKSVRDRLAISK